MTATLGLSDAIRKQGRKQRNADRTMGMTTTRAGVGTTRSGTIAIRRETIESIHTSIFNSPAGSPVLPKGQKQKMPRCTPATEVNVYYLGIRTQEFFAWSLDAVSQHCRSCSGAKRPRHRSLTLFLRLLTFYFRPCSVALSHVLHPFL
jgi:hypothetical protein